MQKTIILLAAIFLVSCSTVENVIVEPSTTPIVDRLNTPVRRVLTGNWGWDEDQCKTDPINISFSADGAIMYHKSKEGLSLGDESILKETVVYQILDESSRALRTVIEGEDRRTEQGNVIGWDLFLIDQNSFFWRRWDWPSEGRTAALISCR